MAALTVGVNKVDVEKVTASGEWAVTVTQEGVRGTFVHKKRVADKGTLAPPTGTDCVRAEERQEPCPVEAVGAR